MNTSIELQNAIMAYAEGYMESFTQIYELSYPYLHTCVIHIVKDEYVAMDMLQETFIEISRNILQLQNTNMFLSWAATIAKRKCFAYIKKQRDVLCDVEDSEGYFEAIPDDALIIPEELLQDREKQRLIRAIIDDLPELQRFCVIGYYFNEQKQEEIAQELGIPVNTVKSHLNRAKGKIKEAVITLDVKEGTRLYSVAPFIVLLFNLETDACQVPAMSGTLLSALGMSMDGAEAAYFANGVAETTPASAYDAYGANGAYDANGAYEAYEAYSANGAYDANGAYGANGAYDAYGAYGVNGANGVSAVVMGATKATGTLLKTKIMAGLVGIGVVASLGIGVHLGLTTNEKSTSTKVEERQEETYVYSYPKDYQAWDTLSRNLAGENRYLYADGNKITMPTTIGEWEELLSVKFVEVSSFDSDSTSKYDSTQVEVVDENGITYTFRINGAFYVPIEENKEAELKQLRAASVVGVQIACNGEKNSVNSEMRNYISLIGDGSMFDKDIEDVNRALEEEYGVDVRGGNVIVDRFADGYTFSWTWSDDGDNRELDIEYVPENLFAFYQHTNEIKSICWNDYQRFSDLYGNSKVKYALADVTYDGIDELVVKTDERSDIWYYDWETGELKEFSYNRDCTIGSNGALLATTSFYSDGTNRMGEDKSAKYQKRKICILDNWGDEVPLVTLTQYNDGRTYCINDKNVSKEMYNACWNQYVNGTSIEMQDFSNFNEDLKNYWDAYYEELRNFKENVKTGKGLKVYDDSVIPESNGQVEAWKENYVALIHEFLQGEVYISTSCEGISSEYLQPIEENVVFNVVDINSDGLPELLLSLATPDGVYDEDLHIMNMFLPRGSWEKSHVIDFGYINDAGTEVVSWYSDGGGDTYRVNSYDGNQLKSQIALMDIVDGYGNHSYEFYDGKVRTEISYEEYTNLMNQHVLSKKRKIEVKKLTIENLEEALDIRIYQLDSTGYKIGPKEVETSVVQDTQEEAMPKAAESAEIAYKEFLSGEREAMVDARYRSSYRTPGLFLQGEKLSLTQMAKRIQTSSIVTGEGMQDIKYGYLDCGNDKEQELALQFYNPETYSKCILILKYNSGQVYVTYSVLDSDYHGYAYLYTNGSIQLQSYGGVNEYSFRTSGLDNNGVKHVISDVRWYENDEETIDKQFDEAIEGMSINRMLGKNYYTLVCKEGYELEKAVQGAESYFKENGMKDMIFIDSEELNKLIEHRKERLNISTVEDAGEITWMDLQK